MEKSQYKLCIEVLRRLEKDGVLQDMILIGSWCMPFYKDYFSDIDYLPAMKTRDIDFLIPRPEEIKSKADISEIMKDLGFIMGFHGRAGYIILEHPELAIEFLVPEKGKGTDKPVQLPLLGLNAQALRFLELLAQDTIDVKADGISLTLPHPANFALHKLIVSQRRRQTHKSEKDREAGLKILKALMDKQEHNLIKDVFDSLPKKWHGMNLKAVNASEENIIIQELSGK